MLQVLHPATNLLHHILQYPQIQQITAKSPFFVDLNTSKKEQYNL